MLFERIACGFDSGKRREIQSTGNHTHTAQSDQRAWAITSPLRLLRGPPARAIAKTESSYPTQGRRERSRLGGFARLDFEATSLTLFTSQHRLYDPRDACFTQ